MARKKPGRRNRTPDKLTPAAQQVIVESVAGGVPLKYAAIRGGTTYRTVRVWVVRGEKEKAGIYASFFAALRKAEADRLAASVARIGRAAQGGLVERTTTTETRTDGTVLTRVVEKVCPGDWLADKWYLESRYSDEFAGNRREMRELQRQLDTLTKAIKNGHLGGTDPGGKTPDPKVSGDVEPGTRPGSKP